MHIIQELINQAKSNQWPYPQLFESLKNAGVISYTVDFANNKGYSALYVTNSETIREETPEGYTETLPNHNFDENKIKEAIIDRAHKKNTFAEFLSRLADAGVSHYSVDMQKRLITYYNDNENYFYQQNVPLVSQI